jgi:hypothetical protein
MQTEIKLIPGAVWGLVNTIRAKMEWPVSNPNKK